MSRKMAAGFALILFLGSVAVAATPERAKGISMHQLPKGVADLGGRKWGFTVTPSSLLTGDAGSVTLQTPDEFLAFVQKQSASVKENGVWIVTTHPDAYSDREKDLLNQVIAVCQKSGITLFVARASELPDGWKQYSPTH
jgi:hypothetical protein